MQILAFIDSSVLEVQILTVCKLHREIMEVIQRVEDSGYLRSHGAGHYESLVIIASQRPFVGLIGSSCGEAWLLPVSSHSRPHRARSQSAV